VRAFAPGALLAARSPFGALAGARSAARRGRRRATPSPAALVGAAALLEVTGRRITPQIRRQVPEHWRRELPLPVAAAGYGVLLGMGFTTFVLTFAVPRLAGVALAVAIRSSAARRLAFGAGPCAAIVALAPVADAPVGIRATELMASGPASCAASASPTRSRSPCARSC
jgi:hypothetical protein